MRRKILHILQILLGVTAILMPVIKITATGGGVRISYEYYAFELVLLLAATLAFRAERCPHCKKQVGFKDKQTCPHCGELLDV